MPVSPHLDTQCSCARSAADDDTAGKRIAHGVGNEIDDEPFEQDRIAHRPGRAVHDADFSPSRRAESENVVPMRMSRGEPRSPRRWARSRRLPACHVEKRVEKVVHRSDRRTDPANEAPCSAASRSAVSCETKRFNACSGCRRSWLADARNRDLKRLASSNARLFLRPPGSSAKALPALLHHSLQPLGPPAPFRRAARRVPACSCETSRPR